MKIVQAEVIVTSPDRNFVTLKITTDEGHTGLGDATLNGRELAVVRSAVTHTGGITPMKKLLDFAAQYQIKSGIHGPTDISPVGMAAAMHLGLAIHNFGIQEYMKHGAATDRVFEQSFRFNNGLLHPGEKPGIGVELNVDEAGKYPYQTAYLPFNRLSDGTVHDW